MNTYVMIFRQTRPVTAAEIERRGAETSAWAQHLIKAGRQLVPHILDPESGCCGPEASAADVGAWPVTAFLLLLARDLKDASEVAGSHPALGYGAHVEVRHWTSPLRS
jgi:hypothetical protein